MPDFVVKVAEITTRLSELSSEGEQIDFSEDSIKLGLLALAAREGYITLTDEGIRAIQSQEPIFTELESQYE